LKKCIYLIYTSIFSAKLTKLTMIDEISLKEFASGLIDIVKKTRCCISVNLYWAEKKKGDYIILSRRW